MTSHITIDADRADCPAGFHAAGLACGLRKSGKPDLALFLCPAGASAAGVFTKNLVRAAPVDISVEHLASSRGKARAVIINSGCANAATGAEGRRRADRAVQELARALDCPAEQVLVASTGVIGLQLEDEKMTSAYPRLLEAAGPGKLADAGAAIMTTDLVAKSAQAVVTFEGRTFRVAGVAKGSGMIHPNMATMLAVILTDAAVAPAALQSILTSATDRTFNRISVDGDTSTNDCAFAMASGEAGEFPEKLVREAFDAVCRELALKIVRDGEGARKLIHVRVSEGADSNAARRVAETVAGSLLVRTAVAGGDPNWGRILAAIGRSGVEIDTANISVSAGGVALFTNGAPAAIDRDAQKKAFAGPDVLLEVKLGQGAAIEEFFTCDLTEGYIKINAEYTT